MPMLDLYGTAKNVAGFCAHPDQGTVALHLDSRRTQCISFVNEAASCSATKNIETREEKTYLQVFDSEPFD